MIVYARRDFKEIYYRTQKGATHYITVFNCLAEKGPLLFSNTSLKLWKEIILCQYLIVMPFKLFSKAYLYNYFQTKMSDQQGQPELNLKGEYVPPPPQIQECGEVQVPLNLQGTYVPPPPQIQECGEVQVPLNLQGTYVPPPPKMEECGGKQVEE